MTSYKQRSFINTWVFSLLGGVLAFSLAIASAHFQSAIAQTTIPPNLIDLVPTPSTLRVGNLVAAPVTLDGYELFRIASTAATSTTEGKKEDKFPLEQRVKLIENELDSIISRPRYRNSPQRGFDPETLVVEAKENKTNLAIVARDGDKLRERQVMLATPEDAEYNGRSLSQWSEEVAETIKEALLRSQKERSPTFLLRQGRFVAVVLVVVLLIRWMLDPLESGAAAEWEALKQQEPRLEPEPARDTPNEPLVAAQQNRVVSAREYHIIWERQRNTNILKRRLLQWGQLFLWAGVIAWSLGRFPWTRALHVWLLEQPIALLAIWLGVNLAIRAGTVAVDRLLRTIQETETPILTNSHRQLLRLATFGTVIKGTLVFACYTVGLILALETLEIPIAPVLASVGIVGLALSLGSQSFVKDVVNGSLILLEDQYAVGDYIDVAGAEGIVENMNLRITQIRGAGGRLTTVPNGHVATVHNHSKEWSRFDFTVEVAIATDLERAMQIMQDVAEKMQQEPQWSDKILEPTSAIGVQRMRGQSVQLLMWIKTQPLQQWTVGREYSRRLKLAFEEYGISLG
ncbi:MAG: mechanosensitive ion channel family protein [Cyanobacteriota bacterium]|nr:mechanosensitive ion channel family protein [Cyanobacteriota bacterium]